MIVNKQHPIKFTNTCNCIVDFNLLEKAILWWQEKPTAKTKKIYIHGKYPAVSIHNEKIHIHRLLASYKVGRKLLRNEYAHHLNHNKLDASISNIDIIDASIHQSIHNKGKVLSKVHREKIGKANESRRGMKLKKRVDISLSELKKFILNGESISAMARYFNCDYSTVKNRIYEHPNLLEK